MTVASLDVPAAGQRNPAPLANGPAAPTAIRLEKLPFVGVQEDGRRAYWTFPPPADGADLRLIGRTYAAWFLLYAEGHGPDKARRLRDLIEREMPSRHPRIDRAFLEEIVRHGLV